MIDNQLHIALLDTSVCIAKDNKFLINTVQLDGVKISKSTDITHGTICLSIIQKYAELNGLEIVLSCLPILDDNCAGNVDDLISAINWCENNHVDIVNLSLGTRDYNEFTRISIQINEAYYKFGIIFICAASNSGKISFPSYLRNTVGVNTSKGLSEGDIHLAYQNELGINITAYSEHKIHFNDAIIKTHANNSYAAPFVTIEVANLLSNKRCKRNIKDILFQLGGGKCNPVERNRFDWLYNVVIYDYEHSQYNYKFPIHQPLNNNYELDKDVYALAIIKEEAFSPNKLKRLLIFERLEDTVIPFMWFAKKISKQELSLLATQNQSPPIIVLITPPPKFDSDILVNHVARLLTEQHFRVYTITNNIRNLLNGEGVVVEGAVYSPDLEVKLDNSLIDIILVDEGGFAEDISFNLLLKSYSEWEITYNITSEQKKVTLSQQDEYIEKFLVELIVRIFG